MARILFADDDETLVFVLSHYFRKVGHTPLPAPTGHGALLAAQSHPDVILLDLHLPDMSGDEVLRRLKADPATAPIPVVVVSGEPNAGDRIARDARTGAVAVLQKPVSGAELCTVVEWVLAGGTVPKGDAAGGGPQRSPHRDLVARLLSHGSYALAHQVYRCLVADRACRAAASAPSAPSWTDLARAGRQEGLLDHGEGTLLAAGPETGATPRAESPSIPAPDARA